MVDPDSIPRLMASRARSRWRRWPTCAGARSTTPSSSSTRRRTPRAEQMKMFLTRLGFGSKMVVTGDITQVDLPGGARSGLRHVRDILAGIDDIHFSRAHGRGRRAPPAGQRHRRRLRRVRGRLTGARSEATAASPRAGGGPPSMSIDVLNETTYDLDELELVACARYVWSRCGPPGSRPVHQPRRRGRHGDPARAWMDLPGPTDVMSFPMDELRRGGRARTTRGGVLGDIVLCPTVAPEEQARCRPRPRGGTAAADDPRHPAPARLRSRRARGGAGDVRVAAQLLLTFLAGRGRRAGPGGSPWARLVVLAVVGRRWPSCLSPARPPHADVSTVRAEKLLDEERPGSAALVRWSRPAAYLAVLSFVRMWLGEVTTAVWSPSPSSDPVDRRGRCSRRDRVMALVSFVVVGVSPRTLGRRTSTAWPSSPPRWRVGCAGCSGRWRRADRARQCGDAGQGFSGRAVRSESELRDLRRPGRATRAVIEDDEREMIHSVFELGDTVAREVMVPTHRHGDHRRDDPLRKAMSLFLRIRLLPAAGHRRGLRRHRRVLYLKDVVRGCTPTPEMRRVLVTQAHAAGDVRARQQAGR
jgi:hypothetical protein